MRRFIQVAAVAGCLLPGIAWGQGREIPTANGTDETGATTPATGNGASGSSGGPVDTAQAPVATTTTATPAPLPFRNSTLLLDQSTTPETLFAGAQQSYIPSYQWWISLRPRWYFTPSLSLRARVDLTTEWADGGDTTRAREPVWGDIWTDLVYSGIPELAGIKFSVGVRALWPVSLASRMRGVYVALGATAGASRTFDLPNHGGDINVGLSFAGTHAFTGYNNASVNSSYGCSSFDLNTPQTCDSRGGPMNSAFNLTSILTAGYNTPLHGLGINFMYLIANSWAYGLPAQMMNDPQGGPSTLPAGTGNTLRENSWFLASADYEVTREVSLSLGYYVYRPVLDPSGNYGNPFWSPGGNSRIFFTITASLDGIYQTIRGVPRETPAAHASNTTSHPSMNQIARDLRAQQVSNGTF